MRVPSAPAVRSKVDLQIEIVPADGTSAAKLRKRRLRYVAVFGQLSDKPMLVCIYLHEVSDRKHNRGRKINAQHVLAITLRFNQVLRAEYAAVRMTAFVALSGHARRVHACPLWADLMCSF